MAFGLLQHVEAAAARSDGARARIACNAKVRGLLQAGKVVSDSIWTAKRFLKQRLCQCKCPLRASVHRAGRWE